MIVWYGAWIKRSDENKQLLIDALLSVLTNVGSMAILSDYSFLDAYTGESRDGSPAAKFFTGDIVTLTSVIFSGGDDNNMSYASLAIFKDQFMKMDGARAGVCLKSQSMPRTVVLAVWKSLQFCYTYLLTSDYRTKVLPYLDDFDQVDLKYDVFRVVYVSGEHDLNMHLYSHHNQGDDQ
ncbi:hypothetical protein ACS0TY_031673 [Phlomoides rotata]